MNRIIIVSDLGRVRAFRFQMDPLRTEPRWHASELEVPPLDELPTKIHARVSDQAGEFGRGGVPGIAAGMAYGEEHELETEHEKRLIRQLARRISDVILGEKPGYWELAAPQGIRTRLVRELDAHAREHLKHVEGADLTKMSLAAIEERFAPVLSS